MKRSALLIPLACLSAIAFLLVREIKPAAIAREGSTATTAPRRDIIDFFEPGTASISQARLLIDESYLDEAIGILENDLENTNPLIRAQAVCSATEALIRKGDYLNANDMLERCVNLSSQLQDSAALLGYRYHLSGFLHHVQGHYSKAIQFYEAALQLEIVASGTQSSPYLNTLNNLGNVYYRLGDYAMSEQIHTNVLRGRISLLGDDHPKVAGSLGNLGNTYEAIGLPLKALQYHQRALDIWKRHYEPNHLQISYSLDNIGIAEMKLGNFDEAIYSFEKAQMIKTSIQGSNSPDVASTLMNLARAQLGKGLIHTAEETAHRAYSIYQQLALVGLPKYSLTVAVLSEILSARNHQEEALELIDNELNRLSESTIPAVVELLNSKAAICFEVEDILCAQQSAIKAIEVNTGQRGVGEIESLTGLHSAASIDRLVRSLFLKARSLGELAKQRNSFALRVRAFDTFDIALSLATSTVTTTDQRATVFEPVGQVTAEIELFIRTGMDLLEQSWDPKLAARLFSIIDVHNGGLLLASVRNKATGGIETEHEGVHQFDQSPHTFNVSSVLAQFDTLSPSEVPPGTSVVEYFEYDDQLAAAIVNDAGYQFQRIGNLKNIRPDVKALRAAISPRTDTEFVEISHSLFKKIWVPIRPFLGTDHVAIIPSESTKGIPFEALITEAPKPNSNTRSIDHPPFLIRDTSISYAYSASLIEMQFQHQTATYSKELLAFAPVFDSQDVYSEELNRFLRRVTADTGQITLAPLPGSAREVKQIERILNLGQPFIELIGGRESQVLLRRDSNEHFLKTRDLEPFRYVHFATHSFIHPDDPDSSGIILETSAEGNEDGILYAHEIVDLNLDAELVVLSSCDSAIDYEGALELSGFAKSFIYAGAKNLVASIWPSDDVGTQILMQEVYKHLANEESPGSALRLAKLDLLNMGGAIANPYYWAGFIHIGPPRSFQGPEA